MRVLDKILVILAIFSIAGVLIWSSVSLVIYYVSGANKVPPPSVRPLNYIASFESVFGYGFGSGLGILFKAAIWLILGSAPAIFILGFYFAITGKGPLRRTLTALCFFCSWICALILAMLASALSTGMHELHEWLLG